MVLNLKKHSRIRGKNINIMKFIIISFIILISINLFSQKENKYLRSGNDYYEEENYKEAEVDYMKALEKSPESYNGQYNLSGALYKQENFEDASKLYNNLASRDVGDNEKANAFYNLGNSLLKAQKYPESIEFYKNALRLNPGDMDAKYNLEYAKKMLQQQQEQEQNQNQDKDQKDKEDQKKEQEKKEQKEQEQKDQEQDQQKEQPSQKQQQPQPQQISKQDAERMLEALKNDENKTLEKINLQKMQQGKAKKVEKDW